ncbi:MAG: N-acetyltransferase family protein [Coriobacteriia bacterium]
MTIRLATSQDAHDIALVYNQAVTDTTATFDTEPQTDEQRMRWLAAHDPRHPVVVAVEDDVVIGWGSLSSWSDRPAYDGTAEVSIYVERSSLGRGIGGALADELERRARDIGLHVLVARVCSENTASLALSERKGFAQAGTLHEVGYKFGRYLDVVLLEKIL